MLRIHHIYYEFDSQLETEEDKTGAGRLIEIHSHSILGGRSSYKKCGSYAIQKERERGKKNDWYWFVLLNTFHDCLKSSVSSKPWR